MKTMNGQNYFNEVSFNEMCEELEKGNAIEVYIDCIGHTRNDNEQMAYREGFVKKYGDNVEVKYNDLFSCYGYKLKEVKK